MYRTRYLVIIIYFYLENYEAAVVKEIEIFVTSGGETQNDYNSSSSSDIEENGNVSSKFKLNYYYTMKSQ